MEANRKKKILCFVNSDYGQANVFLATAFAIMQMALDVELHIAPFNPLEDAVNETSKRAHEAKQHEMAQNQQKQKVKHRELYSIQLGKFCNLKYVFVPK